MGYISDLRQYLTNLECYHSLRDILTTPINKRGLEAIILAVPFLLGSGNSAFGNIQAVEGKRVNIKGNKALCFISDYVGDRNGLVQKPEEAYLRTSLELCGDQFYIIDKGPKNYPGPHYWETRIYCSESELRNDLRGLFGMNLWSIFRFDIKGNITAVYSVFGNISKDEWQKEEIPEIDFDEKFEKRRRIDE